MRLITGLLRGGMVTLAIVSALPLASGPARAGKLPCAEVIHVIDQHRRRKPSVPVGITAVARELDQDVRWIERCMQTYGRRPLRPAPVDYEHKEESDEGFEIVETNEVGADETGDAKDDKEGNAAHGRRVSNKPRQPPPAPIE